MRQRFTAPAGSSLHGIGLQTGYALGIEIDNPSGSWLYIPTLETFIPPYTVGWSQAFPYAVASCDIIAGNGPSGQVGTAQGDGITVYLSSTPVASSSGREGAAATTFIQNFTPSLQADSGFVKLSLGGNQIIHSIVPPAGQRVRILLWSFAYAITPIPPDDTWLSQFDCPVLAELSAATLIGRIVLNRNRLSDTLVWSGAGYDGDVGQTITITATASWRTVQVLSALSYQLV